MAYCLVTDIEKFMQMDFDTDTIPTETEVTEFIELADVYVDLGTKRRWSEITVADEYYDADGSNWVKLDNSPITTITSVYENTASLGAAANWVLREEGYDKDFLVYDKEGKLYFHNNIPYKGKLNLKISYKHGYTTTPKHIKLLSMVLTAMIVVTAMTSPEMVDNLRGYSIGDLKVFKHGTSPKVQEYYNLFMRLLGMGGGKGVILVS